ncbi:MAG: hypothetical protein Q9N26_02055 [Aquificota bacterium]|nr:hypothetical protein [Aquificota bacterium]
MSLSLVLLLLSCSPGLPHGKWDYGTRVWYERGEGEEEFKVLLKNRSCFEEIKKRFRVVTPLPSEVVVIRLSREELILLSEDECVVYVESPRQVHIR